MHFNFPFTVSQILWTLTFAAQLVLLVVLLGRERVGRFPWFTASIALFVLRLLVEVLLTGRMAMPVLRWIFISLADVTELVGLMVVVELARRAFGNAGRRSWIAGALALLAVSAAVVALWGPWPARKELVPDSPMAVLRIMQLTAQKSSLLVDLLIVQLGLLIALFGRRFNAGWRSHTQGIAIGLSSVAISWLAVQGAWQLIAATAHPRSEQEYERLIGLGGKLVNANKVVFLAALIWWIACLWIDEPETGTAAGALPIPENGTAVELLPETADASSQGAGI